VIRRWYHTGYDVAKGLSGHTADVDFIKVVTYIARNHHPGMLCLAPAGAARAGAAG
jgi:hypothetical protein